MNKQILVVNDSSALGFANAFLLQQAGYEVSQAEDGQTALEMILKAKREGFPFDLLLTDIQMPRMSGIELIHELKMYAISLPVIVTSAFSDTGLVQHLLDNGCSDYFTKPYDFDALIQRIHIILRKTGKEVLNSELSIAGIT